MKIGISALGYECKEHLEEVLKPWLSDKVNAEVIISAAHGVFPETHSLGFSTVSTDGTVQELLELERKGIIAKASIADRPMYEKDLRNLTLATLFDSGVDYLWMLDLQDEIYSVKEINQILEYISDPSLNTNCWFKLRFKNYVFDDNSYIDDFTAPRIWRNDRCGGILGFHYDNEITYNNGAKQDVLFHSVVPKEVAFIKHFSWIGSPEFLKRKINFQRLHYGQCSYQWNQEKNCLEFDDNYYLKNKLTKPTVYKD